MWYWGESLSDAENEKHIRLNPELRSKWPTWKLGFSTFSSDNKPSLGRTQRSSPGLLYILSTVLNLPAQSYHSCMMQPPIPLPCFNFSLISFLRHFSLILHWKKQTNPKLYIVENFKPELNREDSLVNLQVPCLSASIMNFYPTNSPPTPFLKQIAGIVSFYLNILGCISKR